MFTVLSVIEANLSLSTVLLGGKVIHRLDTHLLQNVF